MSTSSSRPEPGARREAAVVAALTVIGGLLRSWSPGRMGLVHFDEGIYAIAGTWVHSPTGLAGLDPTVISYAPAGFPILVGLSYGLLGVSDLSAILVSVVAGTITIPVVAWLASRTFGRGAGAAAAAFAALSGPHIVFSRMALTDASFLLFWLLAIGQGQRFLERPGPGRAVALGLAVGVAQLVKYSGWIAGAVVALGAGLWVILFPDDRARGKQLAIWGWGLVAALIAAVVYWPWLRFVESHGGYQALLVHQRGYMGGLASWPAHAIVQLEQEQSLSGGTWWMALGGCMGTLALLAGSRGLSWDPRPPVRRVIIALTLAATGSYFQGGLFGALPWVAVLAAKRMSLLRQSVCVLVVAWLALALMTPFYHPYARLLLPTQGLTWVLLAGAISILGVSLEGLGERDGRGVWGSSAMLFFFVAIYWLSLITLASLPRRGAVARPISELLEPTDSLRRACPSIRVDLPNEVESLRLYARPPVTFYLGRVVPVAPQPTLNGLFTTTDPRAWALLDAAMVRQGGDTPRGWARAAERWDLVHESPTTLNWPTLLDIDPSAATARSPTRSAPLFLFRPKRPGGAR